MRRLLPLIALLGTACALPDRDMNAIAQDYVQLVLAVGLHDPDLMAFAMSANVVINSKDLQKLHLILKKSVWENERFYKVFMDTMVETGQA